jgi:hypothetical protein
MVAAGIQRWGARCGSLGYGRKRQQGKRAVSREDETRPDEPPFMFEDVWPDGKPFPLSDAECARLVRGHPVRWRGTLEEALSLPGTYEMMDGWLYVRRT